MKPLGETRLAARSSGLCDISVPSSAGIAFGWPESMLFETPEATISVKS